MGGKRMPTVVMDELKLRYIELMQQNPSGNIPIAAAGTAPNTARIASVLAGQLDKMTTSGQLSDWKLKKWRRAVQLCVWKWDEEWRAANADGANNPVGELHEIAATLVGLSSGAETDGTDNDNLSYENGTIPSDNDRGTSDNKGDKGLPAIDGDEEGCTKKRANPIDTHQPEPQLHDVFNKKNYGCTDKRVFKTTTIHSYY